MRAGGPGRRRARSSCSRAAVRPGISTADLDELAEREIRAPGATPSFKGYHGFPASICTSVNEDIVHGIPSPDIVLREGDIISIDCGAIVDGWHGDAALTVGVGEIAPELTRLLEVCETALWQGLAQARRATGSPTSPHAVETSVRPRAPYGIIEEYVGHGIGSAMHMEPPVPNYGRPGRGPRLRDGMALRDRADDQSGPRRDRGPGRRVDGRHRRREPRRALRAHRRDHRGGPWVLTALDGGAAGFAAIGQPSVAVTAPEDALSEEGLRR